MSDNLNLFLVVFLLSTIISCQSSQGDVYRAPAITEAGAINAVIEIPAGTNQKIEFNTENKRFESDQKDGKDRVIDFLPYPANYGFIPSTMMDQERGGDGDALDVLVIASAQPTGTLLAIRPIGVLNLIDDGEIDTKIIAIPVDSSLQIIQVDGFEDFLIKYNAGMRIIETWFLNYKGLGRTKLKGWENEQHALMQIKKWQVGESVEQ